VFKNLLIKKYKIRRSLLFGITDFFEENWKRKREINERFISLTFSIAFHHVRIDVRHILFLLSQVLSTTNFAINDE
jgi:hypothetical protein